MKKGGNSGENDPVQMQKWTQTMRNPGMLHALESNWTLGLFSLMAVLAIPLLIKMLFLILLVVSLFVDCGQCLLVVVLCGGRLQISLHVTMSLCSWVGSTFVHFGLPI